jgi:hypothetical protein
MVATIIVAVAVACMRVVVIRRDEMFVQASSLSKQLLINDAAALNAANPTCVLTTSGGPPYRMTVPGLASAPGKPNTCYFINEDNLLVAEDAGGCSPDNMRLRLHDMTTKINTKTEGLSWHNVYNTNNVNPVRNVSMRTDIIPGFDACTMEFDSSSDYNTKALYDSLLKRQLTEAGESYNEAVIKANTNYTDYLEALQRAEQAERRALEAEAQLEQLRIAEAARVEEARLRELQLQRDREIETQARNRQIIEIQQSPVKKRRLTKMQQRFADIQQRQQQQQQRAAEIQLRRNQYLERRRRN